MLSPRINISLTIEAENINIMSKDTLTLLSFENIIIECFKDKKDFILARVKATPLDLLKDSYYEYYWANSLNRILFKVNPDTDTILKISIKSPQNKLYLLGTVDYYKLPLDSNILLYMLTGNVKHLKKLTTNKIKGLQTVIDNVRDESYPPRISFIASSFATEVDFINNKKCREYFKRNIITEDVHFLFHTNTGKINSNSIENVNIKESYLKHRRVVRLQHYLWGSVFMMCVLLVTLIVLPEWRKAIIFVACFWCFVTVFLVAYVTWYMKSYVMKISKFVGA